MFCIPIVAVSTDEAIGKLCYGDPYADLFEIRLDLMEEYDLNRLLSVTNNKILVTYRSESEGGKGSNDPEIRASHLMKGIRAKAGLLDIELSMPSEWRDKIIGEKKGCQIVISTHIPDSTPSRLELDRLFKQSVDAGADIVKIVTWAEKWEDNIRVLDLIPQALEQEIKIVCFCMGPIGKISRVLSLLMGAYFGFASLETGQESASGQMPLTEIKQLLEYFKI